MLTFLVDSVDTRISFEIRAPYSQTPEENISLLGFFC